MRDGIGMGEGVWFFPVLKRSSSCRGLVLSAVGIVKQTRTLVPSLCLNFVSFRVHIIIAALGRVPSTVCAVRVLHQAP